MTTVLKTTAEFDVYIGHELGISDWITVDQAAIDTFAAATGDRQWIHVDTKRAATEMPDGKTIAHGYLTLSLIPQLAAKIYRLEHTGPVFNYGLNKVRFIEPVPSGSRLRLKLSITGVEKTPDGVRVIMGNAMEREGRDRPALVAETIIFVPNGSRSS